MSQYQAHLPILDRIFVHNLVNGSIRKATVLKRGPMFMRVVIDGSELQLTLTRQSTVHKFGCSKAGLVLETDGKPIPPQADR